MALPIRSKPAASEAYDDVGAIILNDATHRPNSIAYNVSLSGVSIARELSETEPAFHKAFGKPHPKWPVSVAAEIS